MQRVLWILMLWLLSSLCAKELRINQVVTNKSVIWSMDFLNDSLMIFTEKSGTISVLDLNTHQVQDFKFPFPLFYDGQGGLMDVAVSPSFEKDKTIYFSYAKKINGLGATSIATVQYSNNQLTHWKELFVTNAMSTNFRHFGSRIAFDTTHMYLSVGDRGIRFNAQDLSSHAGKILRLNLDGSLPDDNPFVKQKGALKAIYSYGHRNPQGLFYDKKRKMLISSEHGPRGGDEINIIKKGKNYGWPVISHGREYFSNKPVGKGEYREDIEPPVKVYIPSIAPSSIIAYQGELIKAFENKLLLGALKLQHINTVQLQNGVAKESKRWAVRLQERIRDIVEHSDGRVYFSTDNGNIYEITP